MSYGIETYCLDSYVAGRRVSGARLVGQNLYHRLITEKGQLPGGDEELDFGFDLIGRVGGAVNAARLAALEGQIENEALKDERIESADVRVIPSAVSGGGVALEITIDAQLSDGESFSLVVGVSEIDVTLLGLET